MYWDGYEDRGAYWETAQICTNGHAITSRVESSPERMQKRCDQCSAETITACPSCGTAIRGYHRHPRVVIAAAYQRPAFCFECGDPFPWTVASLEAARELALEADSLTSEERDMLAKSIDDLIADTPRTQVSAVRFKRLVAKTGKETAAALRDIIVDVASETAKKALFGG